jgi:hypothetical protein
MPDINIMPPAQAKNKRPGNAAERMRGLLEDPDTFGSVILVIAVDTFGMECLGSADDADRGPWHASTFRADLEQHFGVKMPQCNVDKLMAAVTVVTTDLFFKDAHAFVQLANVLAGDEFDPGTWEKADAVECAWAVTEALILDPPDRDDPEPFSDEVRYYIGAVLKDEGYVQPPDVLKIALDGDFAGKVNYDFADDPEMFQSIYAVQQGKADEVEAVLRESLLDLKTQLNALTLQNGNTVELEKRIEGMLKLNEPEQPEGPESLI